MSEGGQVAVGSRDAACGSYVYAALARGPAEYPGEMEVFIRSVY